MRKSLLFWFVWLFFLSAVTFISYAPSLKNDFLQYDDAALIFENPFVSDFDLKSMFAEKVADDYLPMTFASFAVEFAMAGRDPFLYHLDNLLFHWANVLLVFAFVYLLTRKHFAVAALTSLLFAIHPLHVESVAWLAERKDVLSTFFYMLALITYLKLDQRKPGLQFCGTMVFFILALLSKAMAVTLPGVLLLIDWLKRKDLKISLKRHSLFLAISISFVALHLQLHRSNYEVNLWLGPVRAIESLAFYLAKTFWPFHLSPFYETKIVAVTGVCILSLLLFAVAGLAFIRYFRSETKVFLFSIFFFLVSIAPVLQIVPFGNGFSFADRFMYLPSVGLFLALSWMGFSLGSKLHPTTQWLAGALVGVVLLTFSILTFQRTQVWSNNESLWKSAVEEYPNSSFALNNLGYSYWRSGKLPEAYSLYQKAIESDPDYVEPYIGLGIVFSDLGEFEKAEAMLLKAAGLPDKDVRVFHNLGLIAEKRNQWQLAQEYYEQALRIDPQVPRTYLQLAGLFLKKNEKASAIEVLKRASQKIPDSKSVQQTLREIIQSEKQN